MRTLKFSVRPANTQIATIDAKWRAFQKEYTCHLPFGSKEALWGFISGNYAVFLAISGNCGYASLLVYDMAEQQVACDAFVNDERMQREVGPRWLDYHPRTVARRLFNLAMETCDAVS
jgi:hypothetical protein